ncbi:MAG: ASCH domain-containing protein [Lachnospiraceae bacterium]|nr:ASCH domain-containing protein [Lachnospiraceae bacterium]
MTHQMQLQPEPFDMIKSGAKTIELRLYDEKRRKIRIGDEIAFTNTENGETLAVRVIDLAVFASFEELYKTLPLLRCGYTEQDIASASPYDMDVYYPKEKQKEYGVVGITITIQKEY